ncbi:MAG TPA: AMP-binding protein [Caulobacteraceae bacterium]|nr:AMP-binding protein [Caulobacteraceae bacterium]
MSAPTAHRDTFVRDNLPPIEAQPVFLFDRPELHYPDRLNAAHLLDRVIEAGRGSADAIVCGDLRWSYAELNATAARIAHVLTRDPTFATGARVLLHGPNAARTIAAWFGIVRAGGVVVATMPMLRAGELAKVVEKARISHAIADASLAEAVEGARDATGWLTRIHYFGEGGALERDAAAMPDAFPAVETAADDPVLIAFTSGTTGVPKGCIHYHRDVHVMVDTFSRHILKPEPSEIFCGTPPIAFTFGLGGVAIFPLAAGACAALPSKPGFDGLEEAIERHGVTTLFTAPTGYRALLKTHPKGPRGLRKCVSAGEALPAATSQAWFEATGVRIIDGIGATEMIHIFISASGNDVRPGATGKPVPGFIAEIQDDAGAALPPGEIGRLAVRGPTGCRYLADARQADYVKRGWNMTGDMYRVDEDGYFWFVSRADDMIVSSGYNIGAPEVENALLQHADVAEAAVIGVPDAERGQICKAYVVLKTGEGSDAKAQELQAFVKGVIAPYKYPRAVEFVEALPKTQTGKLQRFRLREGALPEGRPA